MRNTDRSAAAARRHLVLPRASGGGGPSSERSERRWWWGLRGLDETPATKAKRLGRSPFHRASRGPPPPLARGRMQAQASSSSRRVFCSHRSLATPLQKNAPKKVKGAERRQAHTHY